MRHIKAKSPCLALGVSALLTACGGSDTPIDPRFSPDNYKNLKTSPIEARKLVTANESSLSLHVKNGIRLNIHSADDYRSFRGGAANEQAADTANSSQPFSTTNTVEQGVDEADFVKYDGRYLFASTHPYWRWEAEPQSAKVRVLETDPDNASAERITEISLEQNSDMGSASELYLVTNGDNESSGLVTLRRSWNYFNFAEPSIDAIASSPELCFAPQENIVEISHYDLENIEAPELDWSVRIDGYLQNSRKIDNTLYITTFHSPYIPGLDFYPQDAQTGQQNEELIAQAPLSDLMPSISINGSEPEALVNAEDCFLPVDLEAQHGYAGITSIVAIDLENQEILSTRCLSANTQGFYVSRENLYVGASEWDSAWWPNQGSTVIHKFALNDGNITYRSTGTVPGNIGWTSAAFRMQEWDNTLRIVTSWREQENGWQPKHQLTILEDDPASDEMLEVATLPNANRPAPIGKPNEDIYAVRFYENRAFVVTFERIDPLYVIDLNDPGNPFIAGDLEIPGFSTYLHPVGQNYLLGLGRGGENTQGENSQNNVKISLFDVSDAENPVELRSIIYGESYSYSEAEYDHHAISFLQSSADQLRVTLPVNFYSNYEHRPRTTLQLLEINGLASDTADLYEVGEMRPDSNREDYWYAISRGVLHDEAVYHIVEGEVFSAFWSNPGAVTGPH